MMARQVSTQRIVPHISYAGIFNGTSSFATTPLTVTTGAFTVAFWARIQPMTASARIVDCQASGPTGGFNFSTSSRSPAFAVYNTTNASMVLPPTNEYAQWDHFVGTYDGTTANLYINNTLIASGVTVAMTTPSGQFVTIMRRSSGSTNFTGGSMADFVFHSGYSYTANDVTALYTLGVAATGTTLRYDFHDAAGGTLADSTGNGNNGTATSMTVSTTDLPMINRSVAPTRSAANR